MPESRNRRAELPPRAELVEATQAELAATAVALRQRGARLGTLRRQLRARIPSRKFALSLVSFEHTVDTALACALEEQLVQIAQLVASLEASASATERSPNAPARAEELVLAEILGKRDGVAAVALKSYRRDQEIARAGAHLTPFLKGELMPSISPAPPPPQPLKSERIQAPSAWQFSSDRTTASARFELGGRRGAVAFIGLASELAEQVGAKAGFSLAGGSAVVVTVEAEEGGSFSERGLELLASFNRLLGDEASL